MRRLLVVLAALAFLASTANGAWYTATYFQPPASNGNIDNTDARMASAPPAATTMYNLADVVDPEGAGNPQRFPVNNPIPGNNAGGDDYYSLAMSGMLHVTTTGTYVFKTGSDDSSRFVIDGRNVVALGGCCTEVNGPGIQLTAGSVHPVQYVYGEGWGGANGELSVSSDGGTTWNLVGSGSQTVGGTTYNAAPGLVVDQTYPGRASRPSDVRNPGLAGEYYDTSHDNQNLYTDQFLAGNPTPTATFTATKIDYHGGGTIGGHLGGDSATLNPGSVASDSTDSTVLRLSGYLQVLDIDDIDATQPGIQVNFRLGSDDNARLRLSGFSVIENDGGHGYPHWVSANYDLLSAGTGDNAAGVQQWTFPTAGGYPLEVFWHNGGGGIDVGLFSSIGSTPGGPLVSVPGERLYQSFVPEPTTLLIWSLLAGLGFGLGWRRRKR